VIRRARALQVAGQKDRRNQLARIDGPAVLNLWPDELGREGKNMAIKSLSDVQAVLASGDRIIGALVYWRALSTVRVPRDEFRDGFRRLGLGKALGRLPKPETLLHRACSRAMASQGKKQVPVKIALKTKGTHCVYAVLVRCDDHSAPEGARMRYLEDALITLDRGQPNPTPQVVLHHRAEGARTPAEFSHRDRVIEQALAAYSDLRDNVFTDELSDTLMRAMGLLSAIPLRTGVYFAPAVNLVAIRELQAFVAEKTTASITGWEIGESDANRHEAQEDARQSFRHRLGVLVETCREFTDGLTEAAGDISVAARARQFKALEAECEVFADILGDYRDDLVASIAAAHAAFKTAVLGPEANSSDG
jgi:hypothetical protein